MRFHNNEAEESDPEHRRTELLRRERKCNEMIRQAEALLAMMKDAKQAIQNQLSNSTWCGLHTAPFYSHTHTPVIEQRLLLLFILIGCQVYLLFSTT